MYINRTTIIAFLLLMLSLMSIPLSHASAVDEAISAYNSGDYLAARRLFKQIANDGDSVAQRYLAELYDKGQGGGKDYGKAVEWYTKAAYQNDAKAQYLLGIKYANGHGVRADKKLAYAWFAIAFNNGFEKAASPLRVLNQSLPMAVRQEALQLATKILTAMP
jgi:TPR repeat protein